MSFSSNKLLKRLFDEEQIYVKNKRFEGVSVSVL